MLFNTLQEDGDLGIELVYFVYQKEDLFAFSLMSMAARRLRLRFRTLPEYLAATMAALKISETAKVIVSRLLLSMSSVYAPPKRMKTSCRESIIA
jgi:hypothetical protein